jgi:Domain of unknown function (DUF6456)
MAVSNLTSFADQERFDLMRALRRLARRDAVDGVAIAALAEGRSAIDHWNEALAAGWIEISADGLTATITTRGRLQLRRVLSRTKQQPEAIAHRIVTANSAAQSGAAKPGFNACESPVGWLSRRRNKDGRPLISAAQFAAAERLRSDFWFAGLSPRVTTNWSEPTSGRAVNGAAGDTSDNVAAAAERVRRAVAAVGPEMSSLLIDVCCHLKGLEKIEQSAGWPQRSARIVLDFALTRLARHYGIIADVAQTLSSQPVRVQHWGAPGYRPHSDGS